MPFEDIGQVGVFHEGIREKINTMLTELFASTDALEATNITKNGSGADSYPVSTAGVQTLLAAADEDRQVIISVQVTEVFANGDGAQPTFEIGQTGTAAKFAATSLFTGAAAGATFSFAGVLSAGAALIVTAVAGTGTTMTGALDVTAIAVAQ